MPGQAKEMEMMNMDTNETIGTIRQLKVREERELLREYAYLNKLKEYVKSRNVTAAARIASRIQRYEMRLERTHRRVLRNLEELRTDDLDREALERIKRIEDDISFYLTDINSMASRNEARIVELVNTKEWEELEHFTIKNMKRDIRRWLEIDKAIIEVEDHLLSV